MHSKGKKIGYRCLREKQVHTSFDIVLQGNEVEGGEGSRLDAKRIGEDKASEKDRQGKRVEFRLLRLSQKKKNRPCLSRKRLPRNHRKKEDCEATRQTMPF